MANNQLLDNLVGLFHCTQQYENCTRKRRDEESIEKGKKCMKKVWRDYEPCKSCVLPKARQKNEAPYDKEREFKHPVPLVFFTDSLMKAGLTAAQEEHLIDIMVVSRVPYCYYGAVFKIKPEKCLEEAHNCKRIMGVGEFIATLVGNYYWEDFIDYLKRDSKTPKLYWTHLTKCNTNLVGKFAMLASTKCKKYLEEEIDILNPRLIIGLGNDVAKNLLPLECLSDTPLAIKTAGKFPGMGEILDLEEEISPDFQNTELLILSLPAGKNRWYEYWYDPIENRLCLRFLRKPGKPKIFWFNDWIKKAKQQYTFA